MATIVCKAQIENALDELETLYYDLSVDYKADKPVSVIETWVKAIEEQRESIANMARALREYGTIWSHSRKLSVTCYAERDVDSTRALTALLEDEVFRPQAIARLARMVDMRIGAYYENPIPDFHIEDFLKPDKFKVRVDTPRSKMTMMRESINWNLDAIGMAHMDDSVELMESLELMYTAVRREIEECKAAKREAGI